MFIDFSWFDWEWLTSLTYYPIFLWPDLGDYCKRCRSRIEGSSFWNFRHRLYCDKCKPFLSHAEAQEEAEHINRNRELLCAMMKALGVDIRKYSDAELEDKASEDFVKAVVGGKMKEDEKSFRKGGEK